MKELLSGYHALVCGASRGIGRATAHALATQGASVTLLARDAEKLARLECELPRLGSAQHHSLTADLDRTDTLPAQLDALRHPVHILVNNSGGPPGGPLLEATPEQFRRAFERLLIAAHLLTQAVVPDMRAAGYGRIINVISTSVREPIPGLGVSNTIRAACAGWAKTLARELAPHGVTINNILPGFTATARLASLFSARAADSGQPAAEVETVARAGVPAGRFAQAEEIAAAIAFLAAPTAAYITGVSLPVDGGRLHGI